MLSAILVVCAITFPGAALAYVRDADRVDGSSAADLGLPRAAMPDVTMAAGALVTSDGRVLWSRRVNDRRAIASLTKIMTAIVAMEDSSPTETVRVTREALSVGESTSFLRVGERLPMRDLWEALLVKSGNDAAMAIALGVSGSEEKFVARMNAKAAELGLTRTRFQNSHGLDEHDHYSSAADLSVVARYAMSKSEFRGVVGEKRATIGSGRRAEKVDSTNLLLGNYSGANGVKTGYTSDAGYCVIDSAARDGIELYAVVLGTRNELRRFRDARDLLDFGFAHYRQQTLATSGTIVAESRVTDYLDTTVPAAFSEDTTMAVFDLAGPIARTIKTYPVDAPVRRGQQVGVATFMQRGEVIASIPLMSTEEVRAPTMFEKIGVAIARAWRRLTSD